MGRIPESIFDMWQVERIEALTGGVFILGRYEVVIETDDDAYELFEYDGTRDGFQRGYLDWARQNTTVEPPF